MARLVPKPPPPIPILIALTASYRYRPRAHGTRDLDRTLCNRAIAELLEQAWSPEASINPEVAELVVAIDTSGAEDFRGTIYEVPACQVCMKVVEVDQRAGIHPGQTTIDTYTHPTRTTE